MTSGLVNLGASPGPTTCTCTGARAAFPSVSPTLHVWRAGKAVLPLPQLVGGAQSEEVCKGLG